MARVLAIETSSVLILDEFTSMVDRPTAKRMAKGLQKLVKQGTHGSITAAVKQYCVHIIKERERDNQSPPLPENYAC
jgi:ABC-type ATPase with predicted acetyltransferase domain